MSRKEILKSDALDDGYISHLRFVEESDAAFICGLRSDSKLNAHISQADVSVEAQRKWISDYKAREAAGDEYYFVIRHQAKDYGVVRMYDFQPDSFCWGSWIILPERPSGLVTFSALMMYEIGFDVLDYPRSHFDVRHGNTNVINFHLRSGATPTHADEANQYFNFERAQWPVFREKSAAQLNAHRMPCR
ncbi:GNAT family N-acetyltransferase [Phaeovulum vinaykumarii]|uniref:Protein N-acetyltransferase, RimJ/RimL family n=1 Tax=Phaeovulum vinaykumarii TaxID=407234 RepID=A0A1N7KQS7_9RHOB|nr:GNAT family N-acetyltransferase [Phaeovulum vinaykumarii]SIS63963.1 Protein N-acetyltransferase, RimJ/RimL family [Phaeovulum vinaykumarii]SOC01717.1 RimJ/RimL family protein N-acetyltransferase [Phaeovulum vinaykumarii]